MDRITQMQLVQLEALELFKRKNTDYGDSFADYGAVGVLVRMADKIKRYMSVSNNDISLVNDEALRDTLIDLHNYSAMAIMLMDEDKSILPNLIKDDKNLYNKYEVFEAIDLVDGTEPSHQVFEECGPMPTASQEIRDAYIKAFENAKGTDGKKT